MRIRKRSAPMGKRPSLSPGLVQGNTTQDEEGRKLNPEQEKREAGETSKALAGVDSPPSTATPGELQGGSRNSGASLFHMNDSEIPPSPPPPAPVRGPDQAASSVSKAALEAIRAIEEGSKAAQEAFRAIVEGNKAAVEAIRAIVEGVKSEETQSPRDCVDDRNLTTRPEEKRSVEGIVNDNHDPDAFSKSLVPVGPAPGPADFHRSPEDERERGSQFQSQVQMPRATGRRGRCTSIPFIGLQCTRCKSTRFSLNSDVNANAESDVMHYQCNNCKQRLCNSNSVRSCKLSESRFKVADRIKKAASRHTRRGIGFRSIIQALTASKSNVKAMPPPSNPNVDAIRASADAKLKLMPPPSYTRKPNVCHPGNRDTAFRSAHTTLSPGSSSCSDKLVDNHPSRDSNLQLVEVLEPEERFPMETLEAMGPFPLDANREQPPSNQSAEGDQNDPLFANHDSIRGHRSLPLKENMKRSGGGTGSDGGSPSNSLPCPRCKSTNTRFCWIGRYYCWIGRYYCDKCRQYWTLGPLQQHEVQLPAQHSSKGKEREIETPDDGADQFSGKSLRDGCA